MTLSSEQFNKLVTKDEFNEIKGEMMEVKDDVKKILTAVDGLAKSLLSFPRKRESRFQWQELKPA